jgi:serine/threonine protein kinase
LSCRHSHFTGNFNSLQPPSMNEDANPPTHFVNFRPPKSLRARTKDRRHGDLLRAVTVTLLETYSNCSSEFSYSQSYAPRRVLTKLSKGVHNGNYDNAEHDYICRVGDKIVNPDGHSYEILERLGHGTFGQVLKCMPSFGNQPIALKIIKNKPAYFHQATVEVRILQLLNQEFDPEDDKRIVRMLDFFVYRKHLCISFELLSVNLYEVLKQNSFRGVSMALIRVLTEQLLKALRCLRQASVIHCDLKPENVLLSNMHHTRIKLIDFGSACFESHTVYPYIQSRFYRSPEVLLGVPYTSAIDMWSLGCICAELLLGLPIFPGQSEYDQICRLVEVLGLPPTTMLDLGKNTRKYFRKEEVQQDSAGSIDGASGSGGDGDQTGEAESASGETVTESDAINAPERTAATGATEAGVMHAQVSAEPHAATSPPPGVSQETQGDSPAKQSSLHRSSSFLDLLKQRLGYQTSEASSPVRLSQVAAKDSSDSGIGATGASTSEGRCRSTGSGSAVDTSDGGGASLRPQPQTMHTEPGQQDMQVTQPLPPGPARRIRSRRRSTGAHTAWRLKSKEEFERDEHKKEATPKKYFNFNSLDEMIALVPFRPNLSRRHQQEEQERRLSFLQFLTGLLQINPDLRWTPKQATMHSFISGTPYEPDFQPPPDDDPNPSFSQVPPPSRSVQLPLAAMGPLATSNEALMHAAALRQGGAWSVSTGASFSSASSTGSTPTGGRGRNGSVSSPMMRSGMFPPQVDLRLAGLGRHQLSGTTVTPASSPHGSCASTAPPPGSSLGACGSSIHGSLTSSMGGPRPASGGTNLGPPAQTPHRGGSAATIGHGRAVSSRDGSRGSSPWHLPSPMSELSTASDRLNSSQPSGSESCGEHHPNAHCNFDECAFEDPSGQSDTPHWPRSTHLSDSDCPTPRSHDAGIHSGTSGPGLKEVQQALWDNIKYEMSRVERARRVDIMTSPGSAGALGNFREAIGMNENGPVIPFGHGVARSMRTPSSSSQAGPNECEAGAAATATGAAAAAQGFGHFNPMPRGEGSLSHGHLGFGQNHQSYHHHTHHRRKGRRPT